MFGNASLPVSCNQPDPSAYIQGLPDNIPQEFPIPNINITQQQQQLAMPLLGYTLLTLQEMAPSNPARTFLYNYLSRNMYSNEDFGNVLLTIIEYTEALMAMQRLDFASAGKTAIDEVLSVFTAMYAQKWPTIMQGMPQEAVRNCQEWIQVGQTITQEIQRYQGRSHGGMGQQGPQSGGWGAPASWGQGPSQAPAASGWGNRAGGGTGRSGWGNVNRGADPSQMAVPGGTSDFGRGGQRQGGAGNTGSNLGPRKSSGLSGAPRGLMESMSDGQYKDYREAAPSHNAPAQDNGNFRSSWGRDRNTAAPSEPAPTGGREPMTPQAAATTDEGYVYVLASESGLKKTFTMEQPYSVAYDPKTHVLFHCIHPDGETVTEVLKARSEMEGSYEDHEINPRFRPRTKLDGLGGRVDPNWEAVSSPREVPNYRDETDETAKDVDPAKTPLVIPNIMFAHSETQARFLAHTELLRRGVNTLPDDQSLEYYYHHVNPVMDFSDDKSMGDLIGQLVSCQTMTKFVAKLTAMHGDIPNQVWHTLVDQGTDIINDILLHRVQLGWKIGNLVDDWDDMAPELIDSYGEESGKALYEAICQKGLSDVIMGVVSVLNKKERDEYVEGLPAEALKAYPEIGTRLVPLCQTISVTQVPWDASDISVDFSDNGGVVLESKVPTLYKAIKSLVERTRKTNYTFRHRYIMTADGVKLEVHEGYLVKDSFILCEAK